MLLKAAARNLAGLDGLPVAARHCDLRGLNAPIQRRNRLAVQAHLAAVLAASSSRRKQTTRKKTRKVLVAVLARHPLGHQRDGLVLANRPVVL